MASSVKRYVRVIAAAAALAVPCMARAEGNLNTASNLFSLAPQTDTSAPLSLSLLADPPAENQSNEPTAGETKRTGQEATPPAVVQAAPETPNIHGFFNSPFKTAYVTPRGLVVQNAGLVWQPVLGLVLPIGDLGVFKGVTLAGGIWNSVDTAESGLNPQTGAWDEMDVFVSLSANVTKNVSLTFTYDPWNSPPHAFSTEHNIDLKVAYDDSACAMYGGSGFGFHPYIDIWGAFGNSSTVILGNTGGSGYVELGVVPTYTWKSIPSYPITLTMPTYTQVGPRTYWAHSGLPGGNVGLISTGLNGSVPLAFIPAKYGFWHADLGVTYDYLVNTSLRDAGGLASGNTNHNVVIGSMGFGVNF